MNNRVKLSNINEAYSLTESNPKNADNSNTCISTVKRAVIEGVCPFFEKSEILSYIGTS